MGAKNKMLVV